MRHILVATDGSDCADRATAFAISIAHALGSSLSIVTVASPGELSAAEMRELARAEGTFADALESLANEVLLEALEKAHAAGLRKIKTHRAWNDNPAQAIAEIARRENVDAIVTGRRGRGRIAGLILGSVSQKLASDASCAIIIIP